MRCNCFITRVSLSSRVAPCEEQRRGSVGTNCWLCTRRNERQRHHKAPCTPGNPRAGFVAWFAGRCYRHSPSCSSDRAASAAGALNSCEDLCIDCIAPPKSWCRRDRPAGRDPPERPPRGQSSGAAAPPPDLALPAFCKALPLLCTGFRRHFNQQWILSAAVSAFLTSDSGLLKAGQFVMDDPQKMLRQVNREYMSKLRRATYQPDPRRR